MKSLYYYCIFTGDEVHEKSEYNCIVFCPVDYWHKEHCLPDFFFADKINVLEGYSSVWGREECMWVTKKSFFDIRNDLNMFGFFESLDLKQFLYNCGYCEL
jgi:hypothetical protein